MKKHPKSYTLDIASPCGEEWAGMDRVTGGRYCQRCEKSVLDLSGHSDIDLVRAIEAEGGVHCARLRVGQLDRPIQGMGERSMQSGLGRAAAIGGLLLLSSGLAAQDATRLPQHRVVQEAVEAGGVEQEEPSTGGPSRIIQGKISDAMGYDLIGCAVVLMDTGSGVSADIEGFFQIEVPDSLESDEVRLHFSYIGHESKEVLVRLTDAVVSVDVQLDYAPIDASEIEVVIGRVCVEKSKARKKRKRRKSKGS